MSGSAVAGLAARNAAGVKFGPVEDAAARVGLGLMWGGLSVRFWKLSTLGRYFTFTVQTSGDQIWATAFGSRPHRVFRHPGYAGLLAVTGMGLFTGNWLSVI